jgi:hypothetical protein
MKQYHKIQTVYLRNPEDNYKSLLYNQSAKPEFEYLQNITWVFTEKIDGTNIRIMWDGKNVMFGGKTDNAQIPAFLFQKLQELFLGTENIMKFREKFGEEGNVCLYSEGFGAKIQKGGGNYIKDGVNVALFDVKIGDIWLERENVEEIAEYFNIPFTPVIGKGSLREMVEITRKGFNSQWGDFIAEGIVARPIIELKNRMGDRIITKIKHKDFV